MSVRVVARVRPLLSKEHDKDIIVRVGSNEEGRPNNVVKIPSPKNGAEEFSFAFNSVYDQDTTQEQLFNAEVAPHIKSLFQGLDLTIFAYGVTGTGKTHTMRGGMKLADRGVIPRLLSLVYRRSKKLAKDTNGQTTATVALSYYEIYNDKVYDLFEPPEKRTPAGLPLREKDSKTYVVGLSEEPCADLRDFERLYIAANQNRVTAATKLNAHSSRSHAILRVKLTQTTLTEDGTTVASVRESTASAIDLAGSEDNRRTDNSKERLVESAAINKSLFVLSQCVDAIAKGEKRIPYRESKMTRILSLGQNNGITVMILNLAPVKSYHLDTLSSLNVSSRAKRIEVREIENEIVFKQPPRSFTSSSISSSLSSSACSSSTSLTSLSSSGSGGLARQPLRALTSNVHNIQTGIVASKATSDKPDKPAKAFSVYTDRKPERKPTAASAATLSSGMTHLRRSNSRGTTTGKRPSDATEPRPSKLARPSIHVHTSASLARPAAAPTTQKGSAMSAEQIEAIIERKVAEALAARALEEKEKKELEKEKEKQQKAAEAAEAAEKSVPDETVQKRLDALERRIEESKRDDDPRAAGLKCLLLARQHKEVGDDAAALRYYEQALPYFPGQAKLLGKIEKLRAKMEREESGHHSRSMQSLVKSPRRSASQKRKRALAAFRRVDEEEEAQEEQEEEDHVMEETHHDSDGSEYREADGDADTEGADFSFVSPKASRAATLHRRRGKTPRRLQMSLATATDTEDPDDADDEAHETLMTPRKRRLLDIVNSRDVTRIRSLAGVGAKKARDLVDYLGEEEAAVSIQTLAELRNVPGMGGRTVERAYAGLVTV